MNPRFSQLIVIFGASAAMGITILWFSRRGRLSFRYTVGWLGFFSLAGLLGFLSPITAPIGRWLNVTPGVVLTFAAALVLLGICVQLSISISGIQEQLRRVTEEVALLTERSSAEESE